MPTDRETQILLLIPIGGLILYLLSRNEPRSQYSVSLAAAKGNMREVEFLRFNQDGIYGNLLASEEHFQRIKVADKGTDGFLSCSVKHLCLAGSHALEATSHTIAVGDAAQSENYRSLQEKIRDLQHDIQDGKVSPTEGIKRTREIKSAFESFNPSFDVSHCTACLVVMEESA